MVTGNVLCNNILVRAFTENVRVNPRKLQKLLYYVTLEYYRRNNKLLIAEPFAVWIHGPVLQSVYEEFACYDSKTIVTFAKDSMGRAPIVDEDDEQEISECIDAVWCRYKNWNGEMLSELSHKAGSAWTLASIEKCAYITEEHMQREIDLLYGEKR